MNEKENLKAEIQKEFRETELKAKQAYLDVWKKKEKTLQEEIKVLRKENSKLRR
jgi:uncharacterized protein involved in exopolysaccharide biosynthesis